MTAENPYVAPEHHQAAGRVLRVLTLPREGIRPLFYYEPKLGGEPDDETAEHEQRGGIRGLAHRLVRGIKHAEQHAPKWLKGPIDWVLRTAAGRRAADAIAADRRCRRARPAALAAGRGGRGILVALPEGKLPSAPLGRHHLCGPAGAVDDADDRARTERRGHLGGDPAGRPRAGALRDRPGAAGLRAGRAGAGPGARGAGRRRPPRGRAGPAALRAEGAQGPSEARPGDRPPEPPPRAGRAAARTQEETTC